MGLRAPRTKPTKPSRVTARPFRAGVTTELWLNHSDQLIVNEDDNMVECLTYQEHGYAMGEGEAKKTDVLDLSSWVP